MTLAGVVGFMKPYRKLNPYSVTRLLIYCVYCALVVTRRGILGFTGKDEVNIMCGDYKTVVMKGER